MTERKTAIIEEWVEKYSDYLMNYALSKIDDRNLAFDLIQDTFVAAIQNLDSFEGKSAPQTWLVSILKRKIIDNWRKDKSRKTKVVSAYFTGDGDQSEGSWIMEKVPQRTIESVEDKITKEEQLDDLSQCIDSLPVQWRGIIQAKYLLDQKWDSICSEFEITKSNYWVIVHRAKLELRDCLSKIWL